MSSHGTRPEASSKPTRVLIANRGEIAIRIARSARALGLESVIVYSDADRDAEFVAFGDCSIALGGSLPRESYLSIPKLIAAARQSGASLIHPGYGFLSERPEFAEACAQAGIGFVGPSAESMRVMGDKIRARATVDALEVPRVPGSAAAVADAATAREIATQVGYPILLKAAAGGGGKGMRRVDRAEDVAAAFEGAAREALAAFGDGALYVEKLVLSPHHVEVQVFGDGQGGAWSLGERECSIQRRHQKVWEESPSPLMQRFPSTREQMVAAALKIVAHIRYSGAGTLEFIADEEGRFFFLEMNTRLQVEHPVTEWVSGVDLVRWQLELALGRWQPPTEPIASRGAAVEVRLYAEDPQTFLPAPGALGSVRLPAGVGVRVDTAYTRPGEVSLFYDPMIAKISCFGADRTQAIERLRVALDETQVDPKLTPSRSQQGGLRTNLDFLRRLVRQPRVLTGDTPTDLIGSAPELTAAASGADALSLDAALVVALVQLSPGPSFAAPSGAAAAGGVDAWALDRLRAQLRGGGGLG